MPRIKKSVQKVTRKRAVKAKSELTIPVFDPNGKKTGLLKLAKEIFKVEAKPKLLAQYVRVYLAKQRQGTASTKTRGEVVGSTRKIYRQKGTGRARHGDIKAPIFVGGGVVGGPKPQDHSLKLNKKQIKKALFNALTLQCKEHNILGLSDQFLKIEAKTKVMASFLNAIDIASKSILLVLAKMEKSNLILAARNLPNVMLIDASSLNAYQVLRKQKILFTKEGLQVLNKYYSKNENK